MRLPLECTRKAAETKRSVLSFRAAARGDQGDEESQEKAARKGPVKRKTRSVGCAGHQTQRVKGEGAVIHGNQGKV